MRFVGKTLSPPDDGEEPRYDLLSIRKGDFKVFYRLASILWAAALAHYGRRTIAGNPPGPAGYTGEYLAEVAAQTVAAFQGVAIGLAIIALMATPLVAYTGRKMMAIAEIIHKKWVEPILADNYNRGRVEGLVEGRVEGLAEGRVEGLAEGRVEGLAEGRVEGLAEGRVEGLVEGRVEGLAEGRVEGVSDADQEWEAWLTRREIAVAKGEPFDEPPPSRRR